MLAEIQAAEAEMSEDDVACFDQMGAVVREAFVDMTGAVSTEHLEGAYVGAMIMLGRVLAQSEADELDRDSATEVAYLITEFRIVLGRLYGDQGNAGALAGLEQSWTL